MSKQYAQEVLNPSTEEPQPGTMGYDFGWINTRMTGLLVVADWQGRLETKEEEPSFRLARVSNDERGVIIELSQSELPDDKNGLERKAVILTPERHETGRLVKPGPQVDIRLVSMSWTVPCEGAAKPSELVKSCKKPHLFGELSRAASTEEVIGELIGILYDPGTNIPVWEDIRP